jgi:hypothetical protein
MRIARFAAGLIGPAVLAGGSPAADPVPVPPPAPATCPAPLPIHGMDDLIRMSRCDLEALYRRSEMGRAPVGVTSGRAIYKPGSRVTVPTAHVVHLLWQGKEFQDNGMMVNRVIGLRMVHARVFVGDSWLDGKPSLVMDYEGASKRFSTVRDEVREVAPGLYLGIMYRRRDAGPELAMFFTLDARQR